MVGRSCSPRARSGQASQWRQAEAAWPDGEALDKAGPAIIIIVEADDGGRQLRWGTVWRRRNMAMAAAQACSGGTARRADGGRAGPTTAEEIQRQEVTA